ncbi:hypothetical protein [Herpetosiphon gulosus]|uniref:Uncharacterized protein n=1 Tax=Herpetosiphon gulosus TaxID=1973496 RepID=A0ABP9X7Y1_9CHLR
MQHISTSKPTWLDWIWLLPGLIGGIITLLVMVILPPDRTIDGFGEFTFKLIPLVSAVLMIAVFPQKRTWVHWLLLLIFIVYMGYIDSVLVLEVFRLGEAFAISTEAQQVQFNYFYRYAIFMNAFTVLMTLFAYRVGGGSGERTFKLGIAGILILISGINDYTFWLMYEWPSGRPEFFSWASHVIIFTGDAPNAMGMIVFIAIHLILVIAVMLAPIQRWTQHVINKLTVKKA